MQLQDLIKPIEHQTDEELTARLQMIRHNRNTVRPAAASRAKKAAKKGTQARVSKVESLLEGLTPEQIQQLLIDLGEG